MKIAVIVVRVLLGAMYVFASVSYFLKLGTPPKMTPDQTTFMSGVMVSVYLMPLIKVTELIAGLALLIGRFVPLALVVIFPITLNILCYHFYLAPKELPIAIALLLANLFLAYAYRKNYVSLLAAK